MTKRGSGYVYSSASNAESACQYKKNNSSDLLIECTGTEENIVGYTYTYQGRTSDYYTSISSAMSACTQANSGNPLFGSDPSFTCIPNAVKMYKFTYNEYSDCNKPKISCDEGFFYDSANSKCSKCLVGYYCGGGEFEEDGDDHGIQKCPNGTTSDLGSAVNRNDCYLESNIVCSEGTFLNILGDIKCSDCLSGYSCPGVSNIRGTELKNIDSGLKSNVTVNAPECNNNLYYTGQNIVLASENEYYSVSNNIKRYVGSYEVTATLKENYYKWSDGITSLSRKLTCNITCSNDQIEITRNGNKMCSDIITVDKPKCTGYLVYNGSDLILASSSGEYSFSGQGSTLLSPNYFKARNPGVYSITATLNREDYRWSDGTSDPYTFSCRIISPDCALIDDAQTCGLTTGCFWNGSTCSGNALVDKIKTAIPYPSCMPSLVYTGDDIQLAVENNSQYQLLGNSAYTVGPHNVKAVLKDNYMWENGKTNDYSFSCNIKCGEDSYQVNDYCKKKESVDPPSCNNDLYYTGNNIILVNNNAHYELSGHIQKNIGTYEITAVLKDNYMWSDDLSSFSRKLTCSIVCGEDSVKVGDECVKIQYVDIPSCNNHLVYNGKEITLVNPGDNYFFPGSNKAINVGSYDVIVRLNALSWYRWSDETKGDKKLTCKILSHDCSFYDSNSCSSHDECYLDNNTCSYKTVVSIPSSITKNYTGKTIKLFNENDGYSLINNEQVAVGTYNVIAKLNPKYIWSDGDIKNKSIVGTIACDRDSVEYNGTCHNYEYVIKPTCKGTIKYDGKVHEFITMSSKYDLIGNSGKDAKTYNIVAKLKYPYQLWTDNTNNDLTIKCSIINSSSNNSNDINGGIDISNETFVEKCTGISNGYTLSYDNNICLCVLGNNANEAIFEDGKFKCVASNNDIINNETNSGNSKTLDLKKKCDGWNNKYKLVLSNDSCYCVISNNTSIDIFDAKYVNGKYICDELSDSNANIEKNNSISKNNEITKNPDTGIFGYIIIIVIGLVAIISAYKFYNKGINE